MFAGRSSLRRLLPPAALAALLAAAAVLLPPAGPARTAADWTNRAAARFWTPERMADSMPAAAQQLTPVAVPGGAAGRAVHFGGVPSIGMLFSVDADLTTHFCSAGVVHSPGRDLIVTAAHCGPGTHLGFVPQYRAGAAPQPYGIWAVAEVFTDPRWRPDDDRASDYDVAFARVRPAPDGRRLEDVTGANLLARTPGYHSRVTVVGYPHAQENPADTAVTCTTTTGRLAGRRQLEILCGGFFTGTSGSPWILNYNSRTRTGTVIGVIGGLDGGGPNDRISYSPVFDDAVLDLYRTAVTA